MTKPEKNRSKMTHARRVVVAAAFVACVGTGGAVSGAGRYLKRQDPSVRVIAVEPAASPLLSEGRAGAHGIQGIGANFVPATLERSVLDEVLTVTDEEAFAAARALARCPASGERVTVETFPHPCLRFFYPRYFV